MNWFTHMKVGSKLIFGFLVVSLIGAVIGVLGILKTSELSDLASLIGNCPVQEGIHNTTPESCSWALSGGESDYLKNKNVLHVDGIQNVINVLEEIECGKLDTIEFFEGLACIGGCVGGCLTVENNYVAKMYI